MLRSRLSAPRPMGREGSALGARHCRKTIACKLPTGAQSHETLVLPRAARGGARPDCLWLEFLQLQLQFELLQLGSKLNSCTGRDTQHAELERSGRLDRGRTSVSCDC